MTELKNILALDREEIDDLERELFLKDLKRVTEEYFECDKDATMEVTRADGGFLVCVLFTARRIKSVKKVS